MKSHLTRRPSHAVHVSLLSTLNVVIRTALSNDVMSRISCEIKALDSETPQTKNCNPRIWRTGLDAVSTVVIYRVGFPESIRIVDAVSLARDVRSGDSSARSLRCC